MKMDSSIPPFKKVSIKGLPVTKRLAGQKHV